MLDNNTWQCSTIIFWLLHKIRARRFSSCQFLLYSLAKSKDTYFLSSDRNNGQKTEHTNTLKHNKPKKHKIFESKERQKNQKHLARISLWICFLCDEPKIVYDNGNRFPFSLLFSSSYLIYLEQQQKNDFVSFISGTEQKILHKFAMWVSK